MKLSELRYLVALAREGSFSRAAQVCSVSQPTLSMAIARLEDELGVHLFERGKGFVSPTAVGLRVVEQAKTTLDEASKIPQIAQEGRNPLEGLPAAATGARAQVGRARDAAADRRKHDR